MQNSIHEYEGSSDGQVMGRPCLLLLTFWLFVSMPRLQGEHIVLASTQGFMGGIAKNFSSQIILENLYDVPRGVSIIEKEKEKWLLWLRQGQNGGIVA